MGRELKRVPIDFDYPLKQIWKGYLNPYHSQKCNACDGYGYNEKTKQLYDSWYGFSNPIRFGSWCYNLSQDDVIALVEAGRLMDFTRIPLNDEQKKDCLPNGWLKYNNGYMPTAEEVNEWAKKSFGHDSINCSICVQAKAIREGFYGLCPHCNGEGEIWQSDEIKKLHEEWEQFEPPIGEGYQLWETTSEGSPSSPVFATLDELCEWCEANATTFANYRATKEEWKQMLDDNFVCHKHGNAIFI